MRVQYKVKNIICPHCGKSRTCENFKKLVCYSCNTYQTLPDLEKKDDSITINKKEMESDGTIKR